MPVISDGSDFKKHTKITKAPELMGIDEDGNLIPLDDLPLELIPEEDLGIATGEDYNPNQ